MMKNDSLTFSFSNSRFFCIIMPTGKYSLMDTMTVYYFTSILNKIEITLSNTFGIREVKFREVLWKRQHQKKRGRTQAQTCHPPLESSAPPQVAFIGSTYSWPRIEDVCLQHQLYFNKVVPSLAFPWICSLMRSC